MKKYIAFLLTILSVVMYSCTDSKEITIMRPTTFKINPSTVVKPFTYEVNPGELEGLGENKQLRVRLMIYNSVGVLEQLETQFLSSFASLMTTSLDLKTGDYTVVVIADVVEKEGNTVTFEYWGLTDENELSKTKIIDLGYIGGKSKLLGLATKKFSVTGPSQEIMLEPNPVGALLCVMYRHIHEYSDITRLTLETNRSSDYLILNKDGGYDVAVENNGNQYDWRICYIEPQNYTATNIYGYYFVLPSNNQGFEFRIDVDGDDSLYTNPMVFNIKAGTEYYFELDLSNPDYNGQITSDGYEVSNSSRGVDAQKVYESRYNDTFINLDSLRVSIAND